MKAISSKKIAFLAAIVFFVHAAAGAAVGEATAVLESKLTPTVVKAGQLFGDAVSISGDTAVIAAPMMEDHDTTGQTDIGYVFVRGGGVWSPEGKLTLLSSTPGGAAYCAFCHTPHSRIGTVPLYNLDFQVAVSGDTAIAAGGNGYPSLGYQVRIFERSGAGWTERLGIPVPNGAISPTAPIPVALDGDTLALGTTTAANVYLRSAGNWTVQQSVVPSDMASLTRFGHALALSGNTLAVAGASTTNTAVYVFVRSGSVWAQEQKILLPPGTVPAGGSVPLALDGDTLLVGAPADGAAGRVFAYQRSGSVWALQQTLLASDSSNGQAFGFSLALENDKAAIGAATERAVYVFTRSSGLWSEQEKFIPPSGGGTTNDKFPISLSGDTAVIGASGDSDGGTNAGAAYVYFLGVFNTPACDAATCEPVIPIPGVEVTFINGVTAGGQTTASISAPDPDTGLCPVTTNFTFGLTILNQSCYDIRTTAAFNNGVQICLTYDDAGLTIDQENALTIEHLESGVWQDRTIPPVDTVNNIVCGSVSSL